MASLSPHPNPGLLNQPNPLLALPPVVPQEKDAEEAAVSEERTGEEDKLQHHGQDRILEHLPARLNEGVPWGREVGGRNRVLLEKLGQEVWEASTALISYRLPTYSPSGGLCGA